MKKRPSVNIFATGKNLTKISQSALSALRADFNIRFDITIKKLGFILLSRRDCVLQPVVLTTGYTPFPLQGKKLLQTDFQYPFDITVKKMGFPIHSSYNVPMRFFTRRHGFGKEFRTIHFLKV